MPTWHFVRHGQSEANAAGWLAGHVDAPLTVSGEADARALAPQIQALPLTRAFTSDLERAWRTAQLLLDGHAVQARPIQALRERHLGNWERVSASKLDTQDPHLMRWDLGPPGGEAPVDVARRYLAFFAVCPDVHGDTLVVAHGLALKSLLGLVDEIEPAEIPKGRYPNLGVQTRELDQARFIDLLDALPATLGST